MANTILHKRSSTASAVPLPGDLALGELALNVADGKLFMKKSDLSVIEIGAGGISNVVEDTTPQLGGNLDVQTYDIRSTTGQSFLSIDDTNTALYGGGVVNVKSAAGSQITVEPVSNSSGVGGQTTIRGGASTTVGGGNLGIVGGAGASTGGSATFTGGAGGTGNGGFASVIGGASTSANGGDAKLVGGAGTSGVGGDLILQAGSGATDGHIEITPSSSGVRGPVEMRFLEDATVGGNYVALVAPDSITTNRVWVLPIDDPTTAAGQFLTTDASGNLGFTESVTDLEVTGKLLDYINFNGQSGTTYQLVLGDANELVTMTNASANTLTVPSNATVAFPVGTQIIIEQGGAGQTTIAAGGGVTINSAGGLLSLANQYSTATLIKKAVNTWLLAGDLA